MAYHFRKVECVDDEDEPELKDISVVIEKFLNSREPPPQPRYNYFWGIDAENKKESTTAEIEKPIAVKEEPSECMENEPQASERSENQQNVNYCKCSWRAIHRPKCSRALKIIELKKSQKSTRHKPTEFKAEVTPRNEINEESSMIADTKSNLQETVGDGYEFYNYEIPNFIEKVQNEQNEDQVRICKCGWRAIHHPKCSRMLTMIELKKSQMKSKCKTTVRKTKGTQTYDQNGNENKEMLTKSKKLQNCIWKVFKFIGLSFAVLVLIGCVLLVYAVVTCELADFEKILRHVRECKKCFSLKKTAINKQDMLECLGLLYKDE